MQIVGVARRAPDQLLRHRHSLLHHCQRLIQVAIIGQVEEILHQTAVGLLPTEPRRARRRAALVARNQYSHLRARIDARHVRRCTKFPGVQGRGVERIESTCPQRANNLLVRTGTSATQPRRGCAAVANPRSERRRGRRLAALCGGIQAMSRGVAGSLVRRAPESGSVLGLVEGLRLCTSLLLHPRLSLATSAATCRPAASSRVCSGCNCCKFCPRRFFPRVDRAQ